MDFEGKKVFITGAAGFIGGRLALMLKARGASVRGLVHTPSKAGFLHEAGVEVVAGDLLDAGGLREQIAGQEYVFHLGAATRGDDAHQWAANVVGTQNVIDACKDAGKLVRLVHVSTIAAYGYNVRGSVDEDAPLRPEGETYGTTKAAGEGRIWRAWRRGLPVSVIRPGQVYGPRSHMWTLRMLELVKLPIFPFPSGGRASAVYVDDLCDLMLRMAGSDRALGHAFNGTPTPPPTWFDFLDAYARMMGKPRAPVFTVPANVLAVPAAIAEKIMWRSRGRTPLAAMVRYLGRPVTYNNHKARSLLGWEPRPLAEGMKPTENWLREEHFIGG
jgi:nucleoside-diphosphate-sugar epimerase